MLILVDEQSKV